MVLVNMVLSSQQNDIDDDYQLVVNLDNVKNISTLLKVIHFNGNATFVATVKGIKVTVEDSKCLEAHAFIQGEVFQHFSIKQEQLAFRICLKSLLECLNIFGGMTSTAMKMCYRGYGHPLKLLLEEGGVVTDCNIKTQDPLDSMDLCIEPNNTNKVILRAECLRDVLADLDASSELVELRLSPNEPNFRISTDGISGLTQIDIPKDCGLVESFSCQRTLVFRYRWMQMKSLMKMLSVAQKVSLMVDEAGLLSCQIMVSVPPHTCYIECNCLPSVGTD